MANKVKRLFLIGSLMAGAFMALTACDVNQFSSSSEFSNSSEEPVSSVSSSSSSNSSQEPDPIPEPVVMTGITAVSAKENYEYGEQLELTVRANYSDGTSELITDYTVEGYNAELSGTQTVTVSFGDKTCTVPVVVNERINLFPTQVLDSFATAQAITVDIPTPVGYDEWTNATDTEEDGSYFINFSTKDEGTVGVDAIADQYLILLESAGWEYTEKDGVYTATVEEGNAKVTFYTENETFNFRVDYFELYPESSSYASLLKNSSLDNVETVLFGATEKSFLASTVKDGKFSTVDYQFKSDQINTISSNIARFDVKKEGKSYTFTDAKGRKLGATDVGQLSYDEGSTEWKVVFNKDNTVIVLNADSTKGRLAYNPETGEFTTYRNVTGTNLLYPQLFIMLETPLIYATDIAISGATEVGLERATSLKIKCIPENANQFGDVVWTSSNEEVATVQNGVVRGVSVGQATITATTKSKGLLLTTSYDIEVMEIVKDEWTIMVYICGSNLESQSGLATSDIREILQVNGQPDDVNIVLETGGTTRWSYPGIAANKLSRYHVENKGIVLDEQLTKENMGKQHVLESFMNYSIENYPAYKYGLILWNHGGALDGVCFDDTSGSDSLLASEVASACENVMNTQGIIDEKFEFIGYDACLMGAQDIAEINSQYFNYMVCSEEVENGDGWTYNGWVDNLYAHEDTVSVLQAACDSFVDNYGTSSSNDQTLSLLDLSKADNYIETFETFAGLIKNKAKSNLSTFKTLLKRAKCFYDVSDYGLIDAYDAMDKIKANASYADYTAEIDAVKAAFNELVIYSRAGRGAGKAYGLALHACVGSWGNDYPQNETNFNTWRSIFF